MMPESEETGFAPIDLLLVIDADVLDRLGIVVRHLCVGAIDEAVRVKVLLRSARPVAEEVVGPAPLVHLRPRLLPFWRPSAEANLARLGAHRPQVIHCLSADLARSMQAWAARWNSLLVVHLTDLADVHRFRKLRQDHRLAVIASTSIIQQAFLEEYPHMKERVCVVPFGIPAQAEPACLAQPQRVPAVVVTTPLTRDCGLDRALHCLHALLTGGQDVQLFVLSTGPAEAAFRRLAVQLGIHGNVTFTGPLADWAQLGEAMQGADFYLLPGARRRFTIGTLLAMSAGLAIIAPHGTIGDYLIDGRTAALFDPRDPDDLARKWAALLSDHHAARQLAHGALDYVRAYHKASTMVSKIAHFYRLACRQWPNGPKSEPVPALNPSY